MAKAGNLKRYQIEIFVTLFVGYACYAYNRKSVSFATPKLIEEGLDKSQAGLIISSQNVAYAISKFLGGVLSDRISSRLLFCGGLAGSGLATVLFGLTASSVQAYAALWFLNGFAQGCGWPACAKMLRQWYSPSQFGTYWSVLSASANVAGGLSPFFSAFLILNYGWRFSLVVAGAISLALGFLSLFVLVNCPEDMGLQGFTKSSTSDNKTATDDEARVRDLLKSPILWLVSFCYMVVFCGKTSAVDWGQLYLMEDRKRTQYVGSAFTSSVETGGFFGGIIAGYLTDWALRAGSQNVTSSDRGNPRLAIAVYFMAGVMLCLHVLQFYITETTSQLVISILGFILGACFYGPIAIYGVVASESAPANLSGTAHAIVALAANVGAITSGLPFTYVAKFYNWSSVFLLLELVTGFTVLLMLCCRNVSSVMVKQKQQ